MSDGAPAPAYLLSGADALLVSRRLRGLLEELVGDDDRSLALDEYRVSVAEPGVNEAGGDDGDAVAASGSAAGPVTAALLAVRTPPFGTRRRVVVLRGVDLLGAADVAAVVAYLDDVSPDSALVLVAEGRPPARLAKAVQAGGGRLVALEAAAGPAEAASRLAAEAGLRLRPDAVRLLGERLGEETARLPGLIDLLAATFGSGRTLGAAEIAPYLGESGRIPPYQLTGAIDRGDPAAALETLGRLLGSGGMHPLQVMAVLHGHLRRLLRLDDPGLAEEGAAAALGGKVKAYPASLAWRQARLLGSGGIRQAYGLLHDADLALRGGSGASGESVLEALVVRLAGLARSRSGSGDRASQGGGAGVGGRVRRPASRRGEPPAG